MTRLALVRSGGFAGLRQEVTVDTETHPDGPWFDAALSALDLTALGANASPGGGADRFQYDLTVTTESASHLYRFGDEVPTALSPLVDRMLGHKSDPSVGGEGANPGSSGRT